MKRAAASLLILLLALAGFGLSGSLQPRLIELRGDITPGSADPLENAPPLVAFSTVALGGFRGIIADILWMRASRLQDEGRFFELVQLANWITRLEPRFPAVWAYQAWNLAYNISVLFTEDEDKWRWVQHGIHLLRNDGIRYNPGEAILYWELGWLYAHKIGQHLDQSHLYYKTQLARRMDLLLPGGAATLDDLLAAPTRTDRLLDQPEVAESVKALRRDGYEPLAPAFLTRIGADPDLAARLEAAPGGPALLAFLRRRELEQTERLDLAHLAEVDANIGPLDWRIAHSHAIYWAWRGMPHARGFDQVRLDRMVFQSLVQSFFEGRAFYDVQGALVPSANLDLLPRVLEALDRAVENHPDLGSMQDARRNFMGQAVQALYLYHRTTDARELYNRLIGFYPEQTNPRGFEGFVVDNMMGERLETLGRQDAGAMVEGLLSQSFLWYAMGDEERAAGMAEVAAQVWRLFMARLHPGEHAERVGLPPLPQIRHQALHQLLDTDLSPAMRARLQALTP